MTALPTIQMNGTTNNDAIPIDDPIEDYDDNNDAVNLTK